MKKHKPDTVTQEDWDAVESPPLSHSFLSGMKPVTATHPDMPPRVRGPQKAPRKTPVSLRLDESVLSAFRASGRGWQSLINGALLEWIKQHNHARTILDGDRGAPEEEQETGTNHLPITPSLGKKPRLSPCFSDTFRHIPKLFLGYVQPHPLRPDKGKGAPPSGKRPFFSQPAISRYDIIILFHF